jgi:hypothetical protein
MNTTVNKGVCDPTYGVDVDNDKPTKNPVKHVRFDVSDGDDDHDHDHDEEDKENVQFWIEDEHSAEPQTRV